MCEEEPIPIPTDLGVMLFSKSDLLGLAALTRQHLFRKQFEGGEPNETEIRQYDSNEPGRTRQYGTDSNNQE